MKQIIIFTFSKGKENIPEKLIKAGIDLKLVSIISNKKNFQAVLRENRPKVVLVDGELPDSLFLNSIDIAEQAISDFDMDLRICVFEKNRQTPGTVFLENFTQLKFFFEAIID